MEEEEEAREIPGSVVPRAKMMIIGAHFPLTSSSRVITTFESRVCTLEAWCASWMARNWFSSVMAGLTAAAAANTGRRGRRKSEECMVRHWTPPSDRLERTFYG